jgi:hypothetical protein
MNLDEYLNENLDDILDNPDKYISSNKVIVSNKKVSINEFNNDIIEIDKIVKQTEENSFIDDMDEKEYLEYNQEYFDNSNEYYDINCDMDDDNIDNDIHHNNINDDINNDNKKQYTNYQSLISNEKIIEEPTEDDYEDDIIDELYEKMHKSLHPSNDINDIGKQCETSNKSIQELLSKSEELVNSNSNSNSNSYDNGEYFFNLMNIFMKYYNNKFDKIEHFFSNIKDLDKGTTNQMELFFDSIIEFKMFCECMEISTDKAMEHLYKETEPEKISKLFEKWDKQIYLFEFEEHKMISPSLIICLNYIYEKNILEADWNIYNLRDN